MKASECKSGQENYSRMKSGFKRALWMYVYDYRTDTGEMFSCIGKTLRICRKRRDAWLEERGN
jgi:hypothetical protein